jgi:hypothetical protein
MEREKLMERVRALLAQAEHPNTGQGEAEAFTARAAQLMAKYGIDAALVAERGQVREQVSTVRIALDAPYTQEKASLLAAVARSGRCRVVLHSWGRQVSSVTVFGFPADLERVQVLYTSLLVQATRDLVRTSTFGNPAAYRRTWLLGFTQAVSARLTAVDQQAQADTHTTSEQGGRSVALVLADRTARVDAELAAQFRILSGSGRREGYAAGRRADLGTTRIARTGRGQIGGVA